MALITGSNYDHIDLQAAAGGDVTRHLLQDTEGRAMLAGKYEKPSGGIPKTDLSSSVQTSLEKADSALQTVPGTYRTALDQDAIDSGKAGAAEMNSVKAAISDVFAQFATLIPNLAYSSASNNGPATVAAINAAISVLDRSVSAISAVYNGSGHTVYASDSLDSLKTYLTVTAAYSDGSTSTIAAANYTLSGTLTAGTSTITVAYGGKTTTFNVTVTAITLSGISAVYNGSGHTVYTDDSLDSLKTYLTVTATYSDNSTSTIAAANYTLSGTLTAGTSTITVTYGGKTTTFNVTVVDFYNKWHWTLTDGDLSMAPRGFLGTYDAQNSRLYLAESEFIRKTRRGICVGRGVIPFYTDNTSAPRTLYPIPVPPTASKATVTVTPSTIQGQACIMKRTGTSYQVHNWMEWGYLPAVNNFTPGADLELIFMMRADTSNNAFTSATEPTQVIVEFE